MPPRTKNLFDPASNKPFKISRSKLELFMECPRCFYLDRRLGIGRVPGFPFTLNTAVDHLLKKEFDTYRAKGKAHPLMKEHGVDAVPFAHDHLDKWRENFVGIQFQHEPTNFLVFGAVDDVWQSPDGKLIVVDYKATSTDKEITLDEEYRQGYKRQMEVYQWLLRNNGFDVSDRGYFVYVNGNKGSKAFDSKLEFTVQLLPYDGDAGWVEEAVQYAHDCLTDSQIPDCSEGCAWCDYGQSIKGIGASTIVSLQIDSKTKAKK